MLRRAGVAAHCTWIPSAHDIPDAMEQLNPELLICYLGPGGELDTNTGHRAPVANMVPLIVVREHVDERLIAEDMAQGARDTVSLQQPGRLQAVIGRELH